MNSIFREQLEQYHKKIETIFQSQGFVSKAQEKKEILEKKVKCSFFV